MRDDWCIENDFAAQKEFADSRENVIYKLRADLLDQRVKRSNLLLEFEEYKAAMEWELGSDTTNKILSKYRESIIKTPLQ